MNDSLLYNQINTNIFRENELIYINKSFEQTQPHCHTHSFIEISYVISGNGIHRIRNSEFNVSKGHLFIIDSDIPHEFRSLNDNPSSTLVIFNCAFSPEFIDNTLIGSKKFSNILNSLIFKSLFPEELAKPVNISMIEDTTSETYDIFEKMHDEYQKMKPGYHELLRLLLNELLILIFRLRNNQSEDSSFQIIDKQRVQILENVLSYLQLNYKSEIKLEELSSIFHITKNHLCKIFKEYTNLTISEYIQKARINEACKLLRTTDKTVIEIASIVGYNNLKFFNEIFKRYTDRTPGNFRKSLLGP